METVIREDVVPIAHQALAMLAIYKQQQKTSLGEALGVSAGCADTKEQSYFWLWRGVCSTPAQLAQSSEVPRREHGLLSAVGCAHQ